MKKLDRLVLKELIGPWLFGVGLFTVLLVAATYLGRITGYIVDGVAPNLIGELLLLLVPAMLVKTFSMAVLLSALLAFGRLSSDSEIVALGAGGAPLTRIVRPVFCFALVVSIFTFVFNETLVPYAANRSRFLVSEIARTANPTAAMPVARAEIEDFRLRAFVNAENVNPASQVLQGVVLTAYNDEGKRSFLMMARELMYDGNRSWRVLGGATLATPDFRTILEIPGDIWPKEIPRLQSTFQEVIASGPPDFDSKSMAQLGRIIRDSRRIGNMTHGQIANFEFGFWNKIAVPLSAIVFGTLGAVLGIRNHRTGTATGFAIAIAIIFGYVTLMNFMNVWAIGGVIPAYVASFAPLLVGGAATSIIMWRRNS